MYLLVKYSNLEAVWVTNPIRQHQITSNDPTNLCHAVRSFLMSRPDNNRPLPLSLFHRHWTSNDESKSNHQLFNKKNSRSGHAAGRRCGTLVCGVLAREGIASAVRARGDIRRNDWYVWPCQSASSPHLGRPTAGQFNQIFCAAAIIRAWLFRSPPPLCSPEGDGTTPDAREGQTTPKRQRIMVRRSPSS